MSDLSSESNPYLQDPGRVLGILVGLIVLAVAGLLGLFGVRGALMYAQGSRAAPADPVASAIGIGAGVWGAYTGLRLVIGWGTNRALLSPLLLFLGGAGSLVGGIWLLILDRQLHGSSGTELGMAVAFGLLGVTTMALAVRRWRRHGADS